MDPIFTIILFFSVQLAFIGTAALARKRTVRISCAVGASLWSCLMFLVADCAEKFNYNVWYSSATSKMLKGCVAGLQAGRKDAVLAELKQMSDELEVTYERR